MRFRFSASALWAALVLAVLPQSASAITYADWIASYGLSGPAADATADPDGDGVPNLMEYALDGFIPNVSDPVRASAPVYGYARRTGSEIGQWDWVGFAQRGTGIGGVYHAGLRYTPRPGVTGIRYRPELTHDLGLWYSGRSAFYLQSLPGGVVQAVTIAPNNLFTRYFARLRIDYVGEGEAQGFGVASGIPSQALDFSVPVQVPRVVADGTSSALTIQDRQVLRTVSASTLTDYRWEWTARPTNYEAVQLSRSSSNPAVIVPDPADPYLWRAVSVGSATLTLQTASSTYTYPVTVTAAGAQTVDVVTGFVPGSLRAHVVSQIDPLLEGKTAAMALRIYTTQNHANASYIRNPNVWAAPYVQALTAISPWNSSGANTRAGVLVSPRHILFAAHYQLDNGASVRFVAADGTVVTRTMTAKATMPGYQPYYPDITVGVLDSDVPASISFVKILPDDWAAKLPALGTSGDTLRLPTLGLDQEEKALVTDLLSITAAAGSGGAMVSHTQPAAALRSAFYEDKISGDSGNPSFLIVNGELVLTTVWTFGGAGSGTSIHYHRAAINTLMTNLGGGYQLTQANWSAFPSY